MSVVRRLVRALWFHFKKSTRIQLAISLVIVSLSVVSYATHLGIMTNPVTNVFGIDFTNNDGQSVSASGHSRLRRTSTSSGIEESNNGNSYIALGLGTNCLSGTGSITSGCGVVGASTRTRGSGTQAETYSSALGANFKQLFGRPMPVPSDVTQLRVRVNNGLWNNASTNTGSITINIGVCPSNGSNACAGGTFTGSTNGLTLPGADIDVVAPSTTTWYPVSRGTDKNVLVIFGTDTGANAAFTESFVLFNQWGMSATGTATLNPNPTWAEVDPTPEEFLTLEYESTHRRIYVQGDSLAAGNSGATPPGWLAAWPQDLIRDKDWAVTDVGIAGAGFTTHIDTITGANIYQEPNIIGADCFIALGTNVFPSGVDALKSGMAQLVDFDKGLGCRQIFSYTVPPCTSASGGNTTDRVYWNTLLRSTDVPPFGLTAIADVDLALDPTQSNMLSTTACAGGQSCDSGDGCHWSAAGQTTAETVIAATLVAHSN